MKESASGQTKEEQRTHSDGQTVMQSTVMFMAVLVVDILTSETCLLRPPLVLKVLLQ